MSHAIGRHKEVNAKRGQNRNVPVRDAFGILVVMMVIAFLWSFAAAAHGAAGPGFSGPGDAVPGAMPGMGSHSYGGWDLPCTKTYVDGRIIQSSSCGDCCDFDEYEADSGGCLYTCSCDYSEERTRTVVDDTYEYRVRGVPVLFQFDAKPWKADFYPIGCAAVAATELMLWYYGRGWVDLAMGYENGSGEVDWETMVGEMAGYVDTMFFKDAGAVFPLDFQPGVEDFIADSGYTANVTHYDFEEDEADERFVHIKSSILDGRPVILGFDSDLERGGLGSAMGDDCGWIDHYALIVGFDDTVDPPLIYVNQGWGTQSDGTVQDTEYEWVIGDGNVHLWFVQFTASEKSTTDEVCPADEWSTLFDQLEIDGEFIGATEIDTSYGSYPVYSRLISGSTCDVIGGDVTHEEEYTYEWTETESCANRYNLYDDAIDGSLPGDDDLPGGDIPEWLYE